MNVTRLVTVGGYTPVVCDVGLLPAAALHMPQSSAFSMAAVTPPSSGAVTFRHDNLVGTDPAGQPTRRLVATVKTPWALEDLLARSYGPLARAFTGGSGNLRVDSIFMGDADVVPPDGKKFTSFAMKANRWPVFRNLVHLALGGKGAHGSVLTSSIFSQLAAGHGKGCGDVEVVYTGDNMRTPVESVRLLRRNGEHFEWRDTRKATDAGRQFEQVVHFGRAIPDIADPEKAIDHMAVSFTYDPFKGTLRSDGPMRINRGMMDGPLHIPPALMLTADALSKFQRLIAPDLDAAFAAGCLTFPPNAGILGRLLKDFVSEPSSGIDMSRVMVHSLVFSRTPHELPALEFPVRLGVRVVPDMIASTNIGEIVGASIEMYFGGESAIGFSSPFNKTEVSLVVRGNFPDGQSGEGVTRLPRIRDMQVAGANPTEGKGYVTFQSMGRDRLAAFASLNRDWNPLHQVDAVGWAAGMPGVVNPGFGTMAQIEAALRSTRGNARLLELSGQLVRPVLPGRIYRVEFGPIPSSRELQYQVFEEGKGKVGERKVIVAGKFVLGEGV